MHPADAGPVTRALRATGRLLLRAPWPLALVLVVAWALLIWDLSSHAVPKPVTPSFFWEVASNLAHAPLFGILTLFAAGLLLRRRDGGWPRAAAGSFALVAGLVLAYGLVDEWHQSRVPGRDSSLLDALTDLVSALMVLWIVRTLGEPEGDDRRLLRRLGTGVVLCVASALLASVA